MKLNKYSLFLASATAVALAGCDKEAAFNMNPGEGQLNCRTLTVDYINNNPNVRSSGVELGDFIVNFVNTATNETARSFKYSLMPEIVSLPEGSYRAEASYGDNPIAEWEAPFYLGDTDFEINAGEITDDVATVECVLSNIRVRVNISDLNLGLLGDDAKVVVHAGKEGKLTYDLSTTNKAGYFRFVENSHTLSAEFSGTVDGKHIEAIPLIFDNVEAGKAYDINFTINRPDNMEPGEIVVGGEPGNEISINATIAIIDQTKVIDPNEPEDNILVDDMRPVNGGGTGEEPGIDPGTDPEDPGTDPQPSGDAPKVNIPEDLEKLGLRLGEAYLVSDGSEVRFNVTSDSGISGFIINIVSNNDNLSSAIAEMLGLTIDLVKPEDKEEALEGLGFATGKNVEGKNSVDFDITEFVPLLGSFPGDHKFVMTITDKANRETTETLWLQTK